MSDESQIVVPPSFIALYLRPGRSKPSAPREEIAARHEFCEDLASALCEPATTRLWDLGVTEADVLERMQRGLESPGAVVSPAEARWVVRRLAEMLNWPAPADAPPPA
ncbi:MAG: ATPase with chaperone activity [Burkholderiales bacterium]|nr:ATPase with chaperone activity [Burkholderiales bacterium]MDE2395404.1 ATPase with chaperone activity [Burkholderiales bacterium]MDE2452707.1 ATPase with chaperone activity [Burkholderiales bacterium]